VRKSVKEIGRERKRKKERERENNKKLFVAWIMNKQNI
jgi:hypothetical protein